MILAERTPERDPLRLGPFFFSARGRVEQNGIARRASHKPSAIEAEVGSSLRNIAQCQPAQDPVALDRVKTTVDTVAHIVKKRRQRFPDARSVVPMPASTRHPREQTATKESLGIDNVAVLAGPDSTETLANLSHSGRRQNRLSPAPPCDRDNFGGGWM